MIKQLLNSLSRHVGCYPVSLWLNSSSVSISVSSKSCWNNSSKFTGFTGFRHDLPFFFSLRETRGRSPCRIHFIPPCGAKFLRIGHFFVLFLFCGNFFWRLGLVGCSYWELIFAIFTKSLLSIDSVFRFLCTSCNINTYFQTILRCACPI